MDFYELSTHVDDLISEREVLTERLERVEKALTEMVYSPLNPAAAASRARDILQGRTR